MTEYRLGLDIGTNSIGFSVVSLDHNNEDNNYELIDAGVRIFSDGRNPKDREPLNVARRDARGIRRVRDRKINRLAYHINNLINCGLMPEDESARKIVFAMNPYEARTLSVTTDVSKDCLARALHHLAVRRGFKSNRKQANTKEDTDYKKKITGLQNLLSEQNITLGQYLYAQYSANQNLVESGKLTEQKKIRFSAETTEHYADRGMYQEEFNKIKALQYQHLTEEQWNTVEKGIFHQRPLKSQQALIGWCQFVDGKRRIAKAMPLFQEYRMYQDINNLKYSFENSREVYELTTEQRTAVINKFYSSIDSKGNVTFKELYKLPEFKNLDDKIIFNLDTENRSELPGLFTHCKMQEEKHFGSKWKTLSMQEQNDVIAFILNDEKEDEHVEAELKKYNLSHENIQNIISCPLQVLSNKDYGSVSKEFIEDILPYLKQGHIYSEAIKLIHDINTGEQKYGSHSQKSKIDVDSLPYYGELLQKSVAGITYKDFEVKDGYIYYNEGKSRKKNNVKNCNSLHGKALIKKITQEDVGIAELTYGKINNPTVHMVLNQLRTVVNSVLKDCRERFGQSFKFHNIHLELARDINNSKNSKSKIEKEQKESKVFKDAASQFCLDNGGNPNSREDITKAKLFLEMNKKGLTKCAYSGETIGAGDIFTHNIEVDHILPFSQTYDDSFNNKVLCKKSANQFKKGRTPFEAFASNPQGYNYDAILINASKMFSISKYRRFLAVAHEQLQDPKQQEKFIARQLNDTRYFSRVAREYLTAIVENEHNVVCIQGGITARYRYFLGFNSLTMGDESTKERADHRHHAIDAITLALIDRSMVQRVNREFDFQMQIEDERLQKHYNTKGSALSVEESKENWKKYIDEKKEVRKDIFGKIIHKSVSGKEKIEGSAFYHSVANKMDTMIISHKIDHGSEAKFHKETAYGIKGEPDSKGFYTVNIRVAIDSFSGSDSKKLYDNLKQIKDITWQKRIIEHLVNENLLQFDGEIAKQKDSINATKLKESLINFGNKHGIKKLRVEYKTKDIIKIGSAPYKGYSANSFMCVDIWQIPSKNKQGDTVYNYKGDYISHMDYNARQKLSQSDVLKTRPHPAAKKIMTLFKDDLVVLYKNNGVENIPEIMQMKIFSSTNNQLFFAPHLLTVKPKNIAISVLIEKLNMQKIAIMPSGKILGKVENFHKHRNEQYKDYLKVSTKAEESTEDA